jgi:serine/threonine protein kinase
MACVTNQEVLDFVGGQLDASQRAQAERHFGDCDSCRSVLVECARGDAQVEGSLLRSGRYRVEGPIGAGAMGVVYSARDLQLDRKVALKLLRPDAPGVAPEAQRSLMLAEARALARLAHPNVLAVHDVGDDGERLFMAMELVEGGTLTAWLRERSRPLSSVLDAFVQAGRGLAAAHAAGLVHRDFKPDNVLVGADGRVRVSDFGLAVREQTRNGRGGSPAYMSPEQLRGGAADARSDQFGFCVALFQAVNQALPFEGRTDDERLRSIREGPCWPGTAKVPPPLRALLTRGLQFEAAARFGSMEDLLDKLSRLQRARPSKRALAGAGLVVLALVAGFAGLHRRYRLPRVKRMRPLLKTTPTTWSDMATDGRRLFFSSTESGSIKPMTLQLSADARPIPMETQLKAPWLLDGSPDGGRLLFGSRDRPYEGQQLWMVLASGGDPQRVGKLRADTAQYSADGRRILYALDDEIRTAAADGSEDRLILRVPGVASLDARWSPDGRRIRYAASNGSGSGIWEIAADGRDPLRVLAGPDAPTGQQCGRWMPDGRVYLFQGTRDGQTGLWAMRDGPSLPFLPRLVRLTEGPLDVECPVLVSDDHTVFALGALHLGELVRWNAGTGAFEPFLGGISAEAVVFSPDAAWVVYSSYPDYALWRSRADGSDRLRLTPPGFAANFPDWSPDGSEIVFAGSEPGSDLIRAFVVSARGGAIRRLTRQSDEEIFPAWAPDGKTVLMTRKIGGRMSLQLVEVSTGAVTDLPESDGLIAGPFEAGGGSVLPATLDPACMVRYDLRTHQRAPVYCGDFQIYSLSRDRRTMFFLRVFDRTSGIYKMSLDDQKVSLVASLEGFRTTRGMVGRWFDLTPDGAPMLLRNAGFDQVLAIDLDQ